ncbi:MAG: hypothetical protein AB2569_05300 [Candidatus Thiodiazotropha endolucinida]
MADICYCLKLLDQTIEGCLIVVLSPACESDGDSLVVSYEIGVLPAFLQPIINKLDFQV